MRLFLILISFAVSFALKAQSGFALVSATDVNFRKLPDVKAELIKKVQLGTIAKVLQEPTVEQNWYKLQIGNQTGWISADFVFDLIPLEREGGQKLFTKKYIPYIAQSRKETDMEKRANFLVLIEGETLSVNSKVYPVKIVNPGQGYDLETYRGTYLSAVPYPDLYHELSDGTITLSYSYSFIYCVMYVFEIKPKISEGIFEAKLKYYYNKRHDD